MKYINKFNFFNRLVENQSQNTKLIELSDYLQEIFDKYNIKEGEPDDKDGYDAEDRKLEWYIDEKYIETNNPYGRIIIKNIPMKIFKELYSDIHDYKKTIESRIKNTLSVYMFGRNIVIKLMYS